MLTGAVWALSFYVVTLLQADASAVARAEAHLKDGRPQEAVEVLTPVLQGDEAANVRALVLRGTAYQSMGEPRSAASDFERAAALRPDDLEARVRLGQARLSLGRAAEAEADFERAVSLAPENGATHFLLGVARFRQENLEGARAALARALSLSPRNARVPILLTRVLDELGAFADAESVLDAVLRDWREDRSELEALAYGYLEQKDDNRAARVFERLAESPDASAPVLVNLGYCYMNVGAFEKAQPPLERALRKEPNRGFASYLLGSALLKLGDEPGARAALERALADVTDLGEASPRAGDNVRALAHAELARLLSSQGRIEEAIAHSRQAIAASPYRAEPHYLLGQLLARSNDPDGARAALAEFQGLKDLETEVDEVTNRVLLNPQDVNSLVELHRLYLRQARIDKALDALRQARAVDAEHPAVLLASAEVRRAQGDVASARAQLDELLAREENNVEALYLLATLELMESDFAAAERALRRLLEVQPDHARAASDLGVLLDRDGRSDEAITFFERSIASDPELALARNGLGVVLFKQGELDRARALFEKARDLAPEYVQARQNLAATYRRLGLEAEAEAELAAIRELSSRER